MKRYTVEFQSGTPSISLKDLKYEVEQVLLRLHPRITFKMGEAFWGVDGKLLAEIAVDGKRALLEQAFSTRKWVLPVQFERLSWGWTIENEEAELLLTANAPLAADPLAGVQPLDTGREFPISVLRVHGKYLALLVSTLVLLVIMAANLARLASKVLEGLFILFFAVFLFTLNDTPLDFRVYERRITIHQDALEVVYWLNNKPARLAWRDIWGVDFREPVCTVFAKGAKARFLLSERFGCREKLSVMKTIVQRAGLSYVEGTFGKTVYRNPDAGEGD